MNNFSITNRLRRVFNITENSLNDRKVIFPIDIFMAMILENTEILKDLNNHFFHKINKYKEIALNLPKTIETRDELSDTQFNSMMEKGLLQAKANESKPAKEVFANLRKRI